MAKTNLCQTRLSHVSASYTSQIYQNATVNQDMKELPKLSQRIEQLRSKQSLLKVKRK